MKASLGVLLLAGSLLVQMLVEVLQYLGIHELSSLWGISSALWKIGLLIILVKALNSQKLKGFLEE